MKIIYTFYLLVFVVSNLFPQKNDSWKVYDNSQIAIVNITIASNDLQFLYNNYNIDTAFTASLQFQNAFINDSVDSVGISIRGNTSRESFKKSFEIDFNKFKKGRKFYSLEELNLNGEHNDPSIARSKICWDFFNSIGMISTRASYASVYFNGNYYGLYISTEKIDENFVKNNYENNNGNLWKCLYGANLNYINDDPNSYKIESSDSRIYDLVTNKSEDDYSKLSEFIDFLNNSDYVTFKNELPQKINIQELLQYFAANVLLGNWDDYWSLSNNYFLYFEPSKNYFHIIPYDYDNSLGISWSNIDWATVNPYVFGKVVDGYRPLIERTLQIPEFRNLYSHILDHFSKIKEKTSLSEQSILQIKNQISPYAQNDNYRTLDYGFTYDDFDKSFFQQNFSKLHVKYSIQEFLNKRLTNISNQINFVDSDPIVYSLDVFPQYLSFSDSININCSAFSTKGIKSVNVVLRNKNAVEIIKNELNYLPEITSIEIQKNDLWKGSISNVPKGFSGTLSIFVEDNSGKVIEYPSGGLEIISAGEVSNELTINEIMCTNTSSIKDNFDENEDWMELYNPQDTAINLTGKYLTDKKDNLVKWQFGENIKIEPKSYLLVWCDEDGSQGDLHANFKLSSSGEFTAIVDTDGVTIIDSVTIPALPENESFARDNNSGEWYITNSTTPGASNIITNIKSNELIKNKFSLSAYPNPFNPVTKINYEIPEESIVKISVYNNIGKEITTLFNSKQKPGNYNIEWNAKDYASSVYFIKVQSGKYFKTLKVILIK